MLPGGMVGRIRCISIASDTNPHAKYERGAVTRSPLVRLESELLQVVVKIVCDLVHEMNPPLAEDVMLGAWIREIV